MKRPEDRLQSRVRMYLADALPAPGYWSSVDHARKQSVKSGQLQKARGIKRGLPDVMIWYRGMFHGIELKVGSAVSDAQHGFGAAMEANGFRYVVVRSVYALDAYLRASGVPVLPSMQIAALNHDAALAVATPTKHKRPRKARAAKTTKAGLRVSAMRYRLP